MITQKKIKEWIPEAVAAFRAVMPPIEKEYPAIYIASEATLYKVRNEPVRLTGSTSYETNAPYSAIMEYIHGDKGDAILIYQKHCLNDLKDFQHTLWHELGHFFAVSSETSNLFRYISQRETDNEIARNGYYFWKEFIAEAISNYVGAKYSEPWSEKQLEDSYWEPLYSKLKYLIQGAFGTKKYHSIVDEEMLGVYFATMITDHDTQNFVSAGLDNKLLKFDAKKYRFVPVGEDFDPTALSGVSGVYGDDLLDLMDMLYDQAERDNFWIIDEPTLELIGDALSRLSFSKSFRTNHEVFENIPKGLQ